MKIISKLFHVLETRCVPPRLSLWRTIYFNFRVLPFSKAIKMPFYIYGRVRFPMLAGKVEIHFPLRKGMIKIGKQDPFCVSTGQGFIAIAPCANLVFKGPAQIHANCALRIFEGELILGQYVYVGSEVKLICNGSSIYLGDYFRCGFQSVIINSGFHSVIDLNSKTCHLHIQPIYIGEKCWVGNRSTIAGGTKLKDGTIVAAGSYVNKDFTLLAEENQMIAGRPAKLIKSGLTRVWSPSLEMKIIKWFKEHPEDIIYKLDSLYGDNITELEKEF